MKSLCTDSSVIARIALQFISQGLLLLMKANGCTDGLTRPLDDREKCIACDHIMAPSVKIKVAKDATDMI